MHSILFNFHLSCEARNLLKLHNFEFNQLNFITLDFSRDVLYVLYVEYSEIFVCLHMKKKSQ